MSVCSEVKRTLVKSPPELWSELGDADSLERHFGDLGEIRIKRAETERSLDWEADGASGSVRLEPSGFGTKVTLSLTRELSEPAASAEPEPEPEPSPSPEAVSPAAREAEPIIEPEPEPVTAKPTIEEPTVDEPVVEEPAVKAPAAMESTADQPIAEAEAKPRRGFFARLFRRKALIDSEPTAAIEADEEIKPESAVLKVEPIQPEPVAAEPQPTIEVEPQREPVVQSEPEPAGEREPVAETKPEPTPEPEPDAEPVADVAVDLAALEAEMAEQDEALLVAMLDRLGAAHHRPFSRS